MKQALLVLSLLLVACSTPKTKKQKDPKVSAPLQGRLYAIGDIHGDPARALEALRLARLVDGDGRWIGGDAVLVQLGDATDRGADSKGALAMLRRLQQEAKEAGGEVILLLGNHEVMNMQGDWRYVSPGDIEIYGGKEARIAAYRKSGEEGAWLRTLPAVAKVGDTLFVHGGILPEWAQKGIEGINEEIRASIEGPPVPNPNSPLWYRGYVNGGGSECALLEEALRLLGARRMVVGHTRSESNQIQERCGGKVLAADTSLSGFYPNGRVSLLEINSGDAKALYQDETVDLVDP